MRHGGQSMQLMQKLNKLLSRDSLVKLLRLALHLPVSLSAMLLASISCTLRGKPTTVIVLINQLGDIVAAEPAARAAATQSGTKVYWIVVRQFAPVVSTFPYVVKAIPVLCASEWILLRRFYDLLPSLNQKVLHIDQHPCNWFGLPVNNRTRHEINMTNYYHRGGLLSAFSLQGLDVELDIRPSLPRFDTELGRLLDADEALAAIFSLPFVVVHFQSNEVGRSVSAEQAAVCADWLQSAGYGIIELGHAAILLPRQRSAYLHSSIPLPLQFSVIARSSGFIGVDSAFAHVANAFSIPSAILIGKYAHFTEHIPYSGPWRKQDGCKLIRSRTGVQSLSVETIRSELALLFPAQNRKLL